MTSRFDRSVRQVLRWLCCLCALHANGVIADVSGLGQIPLPPGAKSRIVALDIVQNGHVVSIATLEPDQSIDETLTYFRSVWHSRAETPGYVEAQVGSWSIISHLTDSHNLVVQMREGRDGVEGVMSALSLESVASTQSAVHDVPPGGFVLSTTTSRDASISATTTVVGCQLRMGEVAAFYRDRLARSGWSMTFENVIAGPAVLFFERQGKRIELIVSDSVDGGSIAVLNEIFTDV